MATQQWTKIVMRRADGRAEVVTRPGIQDPHKIARELGSRGGGSPVSVRHEQLEPGGLRHETLAIHSIEPAR